MKSATHLSGLILLTAILYSGCSKDLLDVNFDAEFQTNLNVVLPPTGLKLISGNVFSVSATIDPKSDPDFENYADQIKDVEIKELLAEVISVNKPLMLLNCTFGVEAQGYNPASWTFTNQSMVVGITFTLGNDTNQWTNVQHILKGKNEFAVSIDGETDQDDLQFTVRVTIKTEVTANPL